MIKKFAVMALAGALAVGAQAEQFVQTFDTGEIEPGSYSQAFTVNYFQTEAANHGLAGSTLNSVTVSYSLESWGSTYTVVNTTVPDSAIHGTAYTGANASIVGSKVPDGINAAGLISAMSKVMDLAHNGNSDSMNGYAYADRALSRVSDSAAGDKTDYDKSGTYTITFNAGQKYYLDGVGAVTEIHTASWAQGTLTVTYDYTPVPEPASMALLGIGGLVVALRRRFGKKA